MAGALDPREVLSYLNQLGYQNITAEQLKDFVKDLKRLIKYERKQKQAAEALENVPVAVLNDRTVPSHAAATKSSKAKQVSKKEIVCVEIKSSRPVCQTRRTNTDLSTNKQSFRSSTPNPSLTDTDRLPSEAISAATGPTESVTASSPKRSKSCDPVLYPKPKSKVTFKGHSLKPKASYILPRPPVKSCKSDPVALYHKYQEEWKKQNIPGEDNHFDLRWAIRERMVGKPRVMSAAPSMEAIARKRKTWSGI